MQDKQKFGKMTDNFGIAGMKTVSNEVDKKLQDANKYADEKRGELVQVSYF